MLAGLPQAPSAYDPVTHLALAKAAPATTSYDQLVANGALTGCHRRAPRTASGWSSVPEYQRIANADANEPAWLAGAGPTPVPFAYRRSCPPGTSRPRLDSEILVWEQQLLNQAADDVLMACAKNWGGRGRDAQAARGARPQTLRDRVVQLAGPRRGPS